MVQPALSAAEQGMSQSAYRTMFAQSTDMCVAFDHRNGRIARCNQVVSSTLGFGEREIVGNSILSLAHPDSPESSSHAWNRLVAGQDVAPCEVHVLRKDGGKVDVTLTSAGVRDQAGGVASRIALMRTRSKAVPEAYSDIKSLERLHALLYSVAVAEARERRRLAAGLHDGLGQLLAIARLKLGQLANTDDVAERAVLIDDLGSMIDDAARSARSTTFELSSPVLHQLGLEAAIQSCGERMMDLHGLRFRFHGSGQRLALPEETQVVLLRVVRELLFNVQKHARARTVTVTAMRRGDRFILHVADDGAGFERPVGHREFTPEGGFGLLSVEAQVHALGGLFSLDSTLGGGTRVTVSVPASEAID